MMTKEQLSLKYGEEKVFVVRKEDYGFISDGLHFLNENNSQLDEEFVKNGFFVYRKDAEYNPDYIQLIPYVLIVHRGQYFVAKRTGGDERLLGKLSIGMGGHINPEDACEENPMEIFSKNIIRELSDEELHIDLSKTISLEYKGLIRFTDPNDIISQDHLGLFYVLDTSDEHVSIKENDKLEGLFMNGEELKREVGRTESWSRIIVENYL